MRAAAIAVVSVLAFGCASTSGTAEQPASAACEQFHAVAVDWSDGVLTDDELRARIQRVETAAANGGDSAVASAAREMLSEVTSGTGAGLDGAVRTMSNACDPYRG